MRLPGLTMRPSIALMAAMSLATTCYAQEFVATSLAPDSQELMLKRADGGLTSAPKFGEQDSFLKPAVAPDGRSVGWLALYPGFGASYSQPLDVVVVDASNSVRRFAGTFGMAHGWCFADGGAAVVLMYRFPQGFRPSVTTSGACVTASSSPADESNQSRPSRRKPACCGSALRPGRDVR